MDEYQYYDESQEYGGDDYADDYGGMSDGDEYGGYDGGVDSDDYEYGGGSDVISDDDYVTELDENKFEASSSAYERVGAGGYVVGTQIESSAVGDIQERVEREFASPKDRFIFQADGFSRRINDENIFNISEQDRVVMFEKLSLVNDIQYKNPIAYVLGYLASLGKRKLDPKVVKDVISKLPQIQEDGIYPPDVVRYARLWSIFLA